MPLLKAQKKELAKQYLANVEWAKNAVILDMQGIPVNEVNKVRSMLSESQGQLQVVKKRVFLKAIEWKLDGLTLDQIPGAIWVLYSHNEDDAHAPLKVVQKALKEWKKNKATYWIGYVGGRYSSVREWSEYVSELADLPSKEELIAKLLFMLNHPVSSFARVLNAIAEKNSDGWSSEEVKTDDVQAE